MTVRCGLPDNPQSPSKPKRTERTRLKSSGTNPRMSGKRALRKDDTVVPSSFTKTLTNDSTADLHDTLGQQKPKIVLWGQIRTEEG